MCGIFGWITGRGAGISNVTFAKGIKELLLLSETRGKESSGICCLTQKNIRIYKECIRAKSLMNRSVFKDILQNTMAEHSQTVMGHARMVTNGSQDDNRNNQPVVRNDLVCIHNGIIVNDDALWESHPDLSREAEVDTEIFLALMEKYRYRQNLLDAFKKCLEEMKGSLSIALADRTSDYLLLYTNTGSLYTCLSVDKNMLLFASEKYILEQTIKKENLSRWFHTKSIRQIVPQNGIVVNLSDCSMQAFHTDSVVESIPKGDIPRTLENLSPAISKDKETSLPKIRYQTDLSKVGKLLHVDTDKIRVLKRCSRCLLPETFPGISFDEDGVCSVCKEYEVIPPKGEDALKNILSKNKTHNSTYDCIIPLSGGRDSCYMLHYMVKELGLKVVSYTYDWGMVTDLARRNIQRMCSALGVEHILISADIGRKRKNVRLNVNAWLKHPQLATIPLFMAGDKQFFYYAQMLKKQMHIDNIVFGMNKLEETQFKVRFASNTKTGENGIYYDLSTKNKYSLLFAYAKEFMRNPAYINRSMLDSFGGFLSYYFIPKDYIHLFDYIPWDQKTVEDVILNEYDWEKAKGTNETWRIGDGTAPFYNYIYYKIAGFTEFDTFKSNQIREGMIDRETALASLEKSNQVSTEDFVWYCNTIGIDPITTLKIINKQKTLYER